MSIYNEKPERSFKSLLIYLAAALAISIAGAVMFSVFLFLFLFGGQGLELVSVIGMAIAVIGSVLALACIIGYYFWTHPKKAGPGVPVIDKRPANSPVPKKASFTPGPATPDDDQLFKSIMQPPVAAGGPIAPGAAAGLDRPPMQKPAAVQPGQDTYGGGARMPNPVKDSIIGIWYGPGNLVKAIFYTDRTFDIIMPSRDGKGGSYIGGTFRRDEKGHYWIRPEFEGATKLVALPVNDSEREFILAGGEIYDANDPGVRFFKP